MQILRKDVWTWGEKGVVGKQRAALTHKHHSVNQLASGNVLLAQGAQLVL